MKKTCHSACDNRDVPTLLEFVEEIQRGNNLGKNELTKSFNFLGKQSGFLKTTKKQFFGVYGSGVIDATIPTHKFFLTYKPKFSINPKSTFVIAKGKAYKILTLPENVDEKDKYFIIRCIVAENKYANKIKQYINEKTATS